MDDTIIEQIYTLPSMQKIIRENVIDQAVHNILSMWEANILEVLTQVQQGVHCDYSFVWWVRRNFREMVSKKHG